MSAVPFLTAQPVSLRSDLARSQNEKRHLAHTKPEKKTCERRQPGVGRFCPARSD